MSFIELDTPNMTPEQMETLERTVNEKIMASIPMYPTLYSGVDDPKLSEVSEFITIETFQVFLKGSLITW